MPEISLRWSEHEASKAYARPFAVHFHDGGELLGSVAMSGADLLYFRQFQMAILTLAGEVYRDSSVEATDDPQRAWLDQLTALLPPSGPDLRLRPVSTFDHEQGRLFHLDVDGLAHPAQLPVVALSDYQEFQAMLAHHAGVLYRDPEVEAIADPQARQAAWLDRVEAMLERPGTEDAMSERWPWRRAARP